MKKILLTLLCLALLTGAVTGCGKTDRASDKLDIVVTIFPVYDWVREIVGDQKDRVNLTMLLDSGVDLHSYQPTADDIVKIATCDLFIYVGGESDEWVKDALKEAVNKDMVVVNLLEALGDKAKEEELVEGMEGETEEGEKGEEEPEYDEHVWLSLKNAAELCRFVSEKLCGIDAADKDAFLANTEEYLQKLRSLDLQYQTVVDAATTRTLLFGDRFPFRYLVDDYGLDYYAAFSGCSAESEASFETIVFLAGKVDELNLSAILQIESADGKIANTIRQTTQTKDQMILTLDSMQSTVASDIETGATYFSIMEKNLEVLQKALK